MHKTTTSEQTAFLEDLMEGYPVEPPRKSMLVNAFMRLSLLTGHNRGTSPHAEHSPPMERAEYEYRWEEQPHLSGFWEGFEGAVTLSDLAGKDVLDVGCAWGGKAIRYAEVSGAKTMTGFDIPRGIYDPAVPAALAEKVGLENCTFTTGSAEDIPFADEEFDVVMLDDVLEHVADPAQVVPECARVLRPGGLLLARFPSIKMIKAHHFDRALTYPALHWIAPMRTWAGGFNHWLVENHDRLSYLPFAKIRPNGVTDNLSGLDVAEFKRIVFESDLDVRHLELFGLPRHRRARMKRPVRMVYEALHKVAPERFASRVAFVGEKR